MAIGSLSSAIDKARNERIQKAFSDLEGQRSLIANASSEWKGMEDFFADLEATLDRKFAELEEKEKDFEARTKETYADLDRREASIASREKLSIARVEEQKQAALAAIAGEKRKLLEGGTAEVKTEGKKEEAAKPEETPSKAKENTAVSVPAVVPAVVPVAAPTPVAGNKKIKKKVKGKAAETAAKTPTKTPADAASKTESQDMEIDAKPEPLAVLLARTSASKESDKTAKPAIPQVKVRPEISKLVKDMDGEGLANYMAGNEKFLHEFRSEVPCALLSAADPLQLVVKALKVYHSSDSAEPGKGNSNNNKKSGAYRRACDTILDFLLDVDISTVPADAKESAKGIAKSLKPGPLTGDNASSNLGDVQIFLKLVAAFRIAAEYDSDELLELIVAIAHRKRVPSLCKPLGLSEKMPEFINRLIKEEKRLEALRFAHTFDLMEKLSPVDLLKAHLRDQTKASADVAKKATNSALGHNEAIQKELSAVRAVIQAIEEYKLESRYPNFEELKRRVPQLEKAKEEKKKAAAAAKAQMAKKPRLESGNPAKPATGGYSGSGVGAPLPSSSSVAPERGHFERSHFGSGLSVPPSYGASSQTSSYPRTMVPPLSYGGSGGPSYSADRNPSSYSSSYLSSVDRLPPPSSNTSSTYPPPSLYGNPSSLIGNYQIGSGLHPPFIR